MLNCSRNSTIEKKAFKHVIFPLFLGGLLYISFRSPSLIMFDWFRMLGIDELTNLIRLIFQPLKQILPIWTYNSFPDGLWVYSFTSTYIIIWDSIDNNVTIWIITPLVLGVFSEIGQGINIINGTFDVLDIFFYSFASLLSIYNIKLKIYNYEKLRKSFVM